MSVVVSLGIYPGFPLQSGGFLVPVEHIGERGVFKKLVCCFGFNTRSRTWRQWQWTVFWNFPLCCCSNPVSSNKCTTLNPNPFFFTLFFLFLLKHNSRPDLKSRRHPWVKLIGTGLGRSFSCTPFFFGCQGSFCILFTSNRCSTFAFKRWAAFLKQFFGLDGIAHHCLICFYLHEETHHNKGTSLDWKLYWFFILQSLYRETRRCIEKWRKHPSLILKILEISELESIIFLMIHLQ